MKPYRVIRLSRNIVQCLIALTITVAIIIGSGCILSRMQLIPAIAAGASLWIVIWFTLTLIFGRIYCSFFCPLGALTDLITRLTHRGQYHYATPSTRLRIAMLVVMLAFVFCGFAVGVSILDPYSAFVRVVNALSRPLIIGSAGLIVAAVTLIVVAAFASKRGRLYCNTICPVGAALGGVSRFSFFNIDINPDLCVNCGRCEHSCPSQCISLRDHTVDPTRCVVCFKCTAVCPNDAITYRRGRHQLTMPMMQPVAPATGVSSMTGNDASPIKSLERRRFIAAGLAAVVYPVISRAESLNPVPLNYVTPPGTASRDAFLHHCTACGACIAACTQDVLKTSFTQYGLRHALAPVMDFDRSYCAFDCVKCTEVCPTKALNSLTVAEKHSFVIGKARVIADNCLIYANSEHCGACARRCPRHAISISPIGDGRYVPVVDFDDCIGCGLCAHICRATPKAIIIEGK